MTNLMISHIRPTVFKLRVALNSILVKTLFEKVTATESRHQLLLYLLYNVQLAYTSVVQVVFCAAVIARVLMHH